MSEKVKVSFSIDKESWEKFKQIAVCEARSSGRAVAYAVKVYIQNFEKEQKDG